MDMKIIQNDPKVKQWLSLMRASEKTRQTYLIYIKLYCELAEKEPYQLIEEAIKEIKSGKLPSERKDFEYITKYMGFLDDEEFAPKSIALCISVVKSFYKAFDISLSSSVGKNLDTPVLEANTGTLKRDDIIKLVTHAASLRDKAIILCMVSSGMARAEILNLRIGNITPDNSGIGIVRIRRNKSKTDYITFLSNEAMGAVKNYMDERNRSDTTKVKDKKDFVFVTYASGTYPAGQKMNERTFAKVFYELGNELGYQIEGGFLRSRSHALRKYFATRLQIAGMPKYYIDFMLGHTVSGTDSAYFKIDEDTEDKIKELYIRYLPNLTFEKKIEVRSLDTEDAKRLAQLEKENASLKKKQSEFEEIQALLAKKLGIETRKTDAKYQLESIWTESDTQ